MIKLPSDEELKEFVLNWVANNTGKTFDDAYFGALCTRDLINAINTPEPTPEPEAHPI